MSASQRYCQHPQVVVTELDGVTSLFQSATCDYLTLNATASILWEILSEQPTLQELSDALLDQFEVDPEVCRREVEVWLNEAIKKKIVKAALPPMQS